MHLCLCLKTPPHQRDKARSEGHNKSPEQNIVLKWMSIGMNILLKLIFFWKNILLKKIFFWNWFGLNDHLCPVQTCWVFDVQLGGIEKLGHYKEGGNINDKWIWLIIIINNFYTFKSKYVPLAFWEYVCSLNGAVLFSNLNLKINFHQKVPGKLEACKLHRSNIMDKIRNFILTPSTPF